jgi:phosphohistidine swiveling domain-containing protein
MNKEKIMQNTEKHIERYKAIVNKKWYIQGFNGCANFTFAAPQSGLVGCHNNLGFGYTEKVFIFQKDYLEYLYLEEDFRNIGLKVLDEIKKDKDYLKKVISKDTIIANKTKETMKKIDQYNDSSELDKMSKKELVELYQEMQTGYHGFMDVSHIIEGISFVVEPLLKSKLEKALKMDRHDKAFIEIFNKLMQPAKPSFANDEHIGILDIMNDIVNDKKMFEAVKKSDAVKVWKLLDLRIKDKISLHRKRFLYNQVNYYHGDPLSETDYVEEIKKLFEDGIDVKKKLEEEKERYITNNKNRKELIAKHNFDDEIKQLVDISIETLHWQDERKKNLLSGVYYMNLMLKALGKRFSIELELIKRYLPEEVCLENLEHPDLENLKARKKQYIVYSKRDPKHKNREEYAMKGMYFEVLMGKEYDEFMQVYHKTFAEKNDIHGTCASGGKVIGIARVCKTKEDLEEFKEGEVLVASMTRPEFVPAMKKASAIVTDEGGLTCHAAIVSRELGKPCIVGTKIATKSLKDGTLVEVNANHGTVKGVEK